MLLKNVTFEMSLKPFWDTSPEHCEKTLRRMFMQWFSLAKEADTVSVQLWVGDGSEILDYSGCMKEKFDWGRYIGCVNRELPADRARKDPEGRQMGTKPRIYRKDCPEMTYGFLLSLVEQIKKIGAGELKKEISVGATFDPGPEFAKSDFKYVRHPEVCGGGFGPEKNIVSCASVLKKDERSYAGFPEGIPDKTPFGLFFGRQTRHFLKDMGFDFIWLSNGFGFGNYPWSYFGDIFNKGNFYPEKIDRIAREILEFWRLFRQECPDYPVMVRGTNLSTGLDLATDAVPLKQIYRAGYINFPPVNSPWAAINRDFGIELCGWMSHIAELPGEDFQFRFYTHDPWWLNSPWLDRYEREPYDIYIPLSVSTIDGEGRVNTPSMINFLSVDNTMGEMPDQVPDEVIPHIKEGLRHAPDAPGPLVWLYPFDEYHDWIKPEQGRINEVFFGDVFIRDAINCGLPLNTVVSTTNFLRTERQDLWNGRILITPPPTADSEWEEAVLRHVESGGNALIYGSLRYAGRRIKEILGIKISTPVTGKAILKCSDKMGIVPENFAPEMTIAHEIVFSAGGMEETGGDFLISARQDAEVRTYAAVSQYGRGKIVWLRGTAGNMGDVQDESSLFFAERLLPALLDCFGWHFSWKRSSVETGEPVTSLSCSNNGFFFSGMNRNTFVEHRIKTPFGAPILTGTDVYIENNFARYHFERTWHKECRFFVSQGRSNSLISCHEKNVGLHGAVRWFELKNLKDASIKIFPESGRTDSARLILNPESPFVHCEHIPLGFVKDNGWEYLSAKKKITGDIVIYW
jgi:hypothetical protein